MNRKLNQFFFRVLCKNMSTSVEKKNYILKYGYVKDILEKRQPFRNEHLNLIQKHLDDGIITAAGPTVPPEKAYFLFSLTNKDTVEKFVSNDPYYKNELVTNVEIEEWSVVVGSIKSRL